MPFQQTVVTSEILIILSYLQRCGGLFCLGERTFVQMCYARHDEGKDLECSQVTRSGAQLMNV